MTIPSSLSALRTVAAVTLLRLARSRTIWVAALIMAMPVVFSVMLRGESNNILEDIFAFDQLVMAVLPGMFVGGAIGEDIEDRTSTYLWSRPIPRWVVLVGKLVALAPIVAVFAVLSFTAAAQVGAGVSPPAAPLAGLVALALATSAMSSAIATLVPKHALALTTSYMVIDLFVGALPSSLAKLSMTHHARNIAGLDEVSHGSASNSAIGIAAIAFVWLVVGLLRMRRLEA